jgi:hypothetical protein
MFDETSHFISATPLTKTFSTFSSVVMSVDFFSSLLFLLLMLFRLHANVVDDGHAKEREMDKKRKKMEEKKRKEIIFLLFSCMLKYAKMYSK